MSKFQAGYWSNVSLKFLIKSYINKGSFRYNVGRGQKKGVDFNIVDHLERAQQLGTPGFNVPNCPIHENGQARDGTLDRRQSKRSLSFTVARIRLRSTVFLVLLIGCFLVCATPRTYNVDRNCTHSVHVFFFPTLDFNSKCSP